MNENKKILVVDDDAGLLYLASKRLKAAGWEPLTASNGVEALQNMLDHPDCRRMITDFHMPAFGGDYWVRFLERFCTDWTIVVISSDDIDSGRFICLPKPIDYENVLQVFTREATP